MEIVFTALLIWMASIVVGTIIDGGRGFLLALLLGWIGVIISACKSGSDRRHKETLVAMIAASGKEVDPAILGPKRKRLLF